jgi:hypothetical protein
MQLPDVETLNSIDMSDIVRRIPENNLFREYVNNPAGKEHYRFLYWLSYYFNNISIIDVGTYSGCSACALSQNQTNVVTSFDLKDFVNLTPRPENVTFKIGNVEEYEELVKKSPLIFYDTVHDGKTEANFLSFLESINYKGIVIFDDIVLFDPLKEWWKTIPYKKQDITHLGHWAGTGIVWM